MSWKWIGAIMIILGCGGVGLSMAAAHRHEELALQQLLRAIEYMACDLQYRLTPLPELCRMAGKVSAGPVKKVLIVLAGELERRILPDVAGCMDLVLASEDDLPATARRILRELGANLGRFDLDGQLKGFSSLREKCDRELKALERNRDERLRSYRTLGFCAGAAIVILFM